MLSVLLNKVKNRGTTNGSVVDSEKPRPLTVIKANEVCPYILRTSLDYKTKQKKCKGYEVNRVKPTEVLLSH